MGRTQLNRQRRPFGFLLVVSLVLTWAFPSQVAGAESVDSLVYEIASDDEVIDSGEMLVTRDKTLISRESFQVLRRKDGGRSIISEVTGVAREYNIRARWDYDEKEHAVMSWGSGIHGENRFDVVLSNTPPDASMSVLYQSGEKIEHRGVCPKGCLMDMMPGALPQFTMTRRYDYEDKGVQDFRWMAFMLHFDIRSFDVVVSIEHQRDFSVERSDGSTMTIRQFAFSESGTTENDGEAYTLQSYLWIDDDHRPLKFRAGQTIGLRTGLDDIADQLVPLPREN